MLQIVLWVTLVLMSACSYTKVSIPRFETAEIEAVQLVSAQARGKVDLVTCSREISDGTILLARKELGEIFFCFDEDSKRRFGTFESMGNKTEICVWSERGACEPSGECYSFAIIDDCSFIKPQVQGVGV